MKNLLYVVRFATGRLKNIRLSTETCIRFTYLCLLVLILSLVCSCGSAEKDWEKAQDAGTIEAVEAFLVKYADTDLAPQAQLVLDDLRFAAAKTSGSEQELTKYLVAYPQGGHAVEATKALEDARFTALGEAADVPALQQFLQQHPDGSHAVLVESKLSELLANSWTETVAKGTMESYEQFLALDPGEPWISRAETKMKIIELAAEQDVQNLKAHSATMGAFIPGRVVAFVFDDEVKTPGMAVRMWSQMGFTPPTGPGELENGDRVLVHGGLSKSTGDWVIVYIEKLVE